MAFLRQCLQELRSRQPGEQDLAGAGLLGEIVPLLARVMQQLPAPSGAGSRGTNITVCPGRSLSDPTNLRHLIIHADPLRGSLEQP